MNRNLLLLFTLIYCINNIHSRQVIINAGAQGYYWRDLTDEVPEDAVPGGTDSKNQTTYIGQTTHYGGTNSILTGPYIPSEKKMYYEYGKQQHTTTQTHSIKLLCSEEAEKLKWISVKKGEPVARGDLLYVHGGQDRDNPLTIGRQKVGNDVIQGKVLIVNNAFDYLYYNLNGAGVIATEYEALFYDKHAKGECPKSAVIINVT